MNVKITIVGVDEFKRKTKNFQAELEKANAPLAAAIVQLVTLPRGDGDKQTYPAQTGANAPPVPFWRRGIGMQVSATHNLANSEQMHRHFTYTTKPLTVTIKNDVSYARYVIGAPPARHMQSKGWLSLLQLAVQNAVNIRDLYALWMVKVLRDLGLIP